MMDKLKQLEEPENSSIIHNLDLSLYELILKKNSDDAIALITDQGKITYGQLYEMADKAANSLHRMSIKEKDVILAQIVGTPESIALLLACSKIGVCAMMLTEFISPDMIEKAMKTYGIDHIFMMEKFFVRIADKEYVDDFENIVVLPLEDTTTNSNIEKYSNIIRWRDFIEEGMSVENVPMVHSGAYDMNICFTSGTSGKPKGIVQTNNSSCNLVQIWEKSESGWSKADTFASSFPLYVTSGQSFCMFLPLALGLSVYLSKNSAIIDCYQMLYLKRPNVVVFVKDIWMRLIKDCESLNPDNVLDLSGLKHAYSVGGKMRSDEEQKLNHFLKKHGSKTTIQNLYGMSESNSVLMQECVNENKKKVFHPMPGVRFSVVDPCTRKQIQDGKIGEIYFQTPSVMREYFLNEEKTAEALILDGSGNTWLISGDLGYKDPNGTLHFIGRTFEKLVFEENVTYFFEIINTVMENPYVRDCCVTTVAPKINGVVCVVLKEQRNVSDKDALEAIKDDLRRDTNIKVKPELIMAVQAIPINKSGKIDYCAIHEMAEKIQELKN